MFTRNLRKPFARKSPNEGITTAAETNSRYSMALPHLNLWKEYFCLL